MSLHLHQQGKLQTGKEMQLLAKVHMYMGVCEGRLASGRSICSMQGGRACLHQESVDACKRIIKQVSLPHLPKGCA